METSEDLESNLLEPEEALESLADGQDSSEKILDGDDTQSLNQAATGLPDLVAQQMDAVVDDEMARETESNILLAITAVQDEGMSKNAAAKKYNIPVVVLKRRLKLLTDPKSNAGRPKFFSRRDEKTLYSMLKSIHVLHQPFTKELFLAAAKQLAEKKGYGEHNFGNSWLHGFIKRHPDLVLRKRTAKDKLQKWNKEKCDTFIEAMAYLNKEGYLDDPRTIFALDSLETPVPLVDKKKPIVPTVRRKQKNTAERGFPVIVCGSADGHPMQAMILREGNVILEPWFASVNQEAVVGHNLIGTFDTESFGAYVKNELVPYIQSLDPPAAKSVIFVDDRWLASYDVDIVETATKVNLLIVPFPTGHNDKVQPLDRMQFRALARIWLEFVGERDRPLNEFVRTNTLARTLMASRRRDDMVKNIIDGFQAKGIYPFEPAVIRSTVVSFGKPALPIKQSSSVFDPFLKRFEGYTVQLGADCGMPEEYIKAAMEAFRASIMNSGVPLQPVSRHVETAVAPIKNFHTVI